ncbi:unnamed protein product, partial [Meganyctiphanes norvegica]
IECVNKEGVDNDRCDLSAALGLCEVNYAYNLRFCAGSCKTTQSLRRRCVKKRDLSRCENKKTLRNPDFECGVPLNRQKRFAEFIPHAQSREATRLKEAKRLAEFIPHAQSREARRLKDPRRRNKKKNNRGKNRYKNASDERIRNTDIWGKQPVGL